MGKRLIVKILYNAFIFCIIAVLASDPSYGLAAINVDLTSVKQKIKGFGGSGAFYESWLSDHPQKQEINNTIFGGLGTSIYMAQNSSEVGYPRDMQRQLASDPSLINVDLTSVKQKIEGFGGSGAFYESWLSDHPQKQEIYNTIFGGLGTSIYRIRNSYEIEHGVDMQHQAEAIQAAERSLEHPVKIMISSWTPPESLKSNGALNRGTLARQDPTGPKDPTNPYKYDEFAEWWANSLIAYKQLGITATYISIQNEPSLSLDYPSCKFTESETVDWAGHDSAVDAVYQQLSTMEESPKILAPDTTNTYKAKKYLDAHSDLAQLYGYAHHLYGMGEGDTLVEKFDNPDSLIPAMRTFRNNYGDKPIFQTEFCRLPYSDGFREAINTAKHIHNSLVEENVAAYLTWGLFWPGDGLGLVLIDDPYFTPEPGYTIQDTYYAFMHYSKYIQPGYSRINISDPNVSGLRASAFKSPDEDTIVLVIINPEEESKEFSASGLDAYSLCQVFRTDSSPDNNCTNITNNWDGNLPGKSITTIIGKSSCDYPLSADVPPGHWAEKDIYKIYNAGITKAEKDIYKIYNAGITKGCSKIPLKYCTNAFTTREQMAVFLGRGIHGNEFTPPDATGIFADVSLYHWAADWIEQAYNDGITKGCSTNPLRYCPGVNVSRAQMAAFLLRAKHGGSYTPPAATGIFNDVSLDHWAADWIEQLYNEGITVGCGTDPLRYCPDASVTRAQMAVFIMRTFGL